MLIDEPHLPSKKNLTRGIWVRAGRVPGPPGRRECRTASSAAVCTDAPTDAHILGKCSRSELVRAMHARSGLVYSGIVSSSPSSTSAPSSVASAALPSMSPSASASPSTSPSTSSPSSSSPAPSCAVAAWGSAPEPPGSRARLPRFGFWSESAHCGGCRAQVGHAPASLAIGALLRSRTLLAAVRKASRWDSPASSRLMRATSVFMKRL